MRNIIVVALSFASRRLVTTTLVNSRVSFAASSNSSRFLLAGLLVAVNRFTTSKLSIQTVTVDKQLIHLKWAYATLFHVLVTCRTTSVAKSPRWQSGRKVAVYATHDTLTRYECVAQFPNCRPYRLFQIYLLRPEMRVVKHELRVVHTATWHRLVELR